MSRGINKVILVGNLGADPETRFTAAGMAICNLRLATTESRTDKTSGEKTEHTEWHRVVLFGKLGEIANEYLKKGRQVYIEGSIRTTKYTDKAGVEKYSTEIIGNDMQMLGSNDGARPESRPAQRQESHADASNGDRATGGFQDDEIPFSPIPRRQLW